MHRISHAAVDNFVHFEQGVANSHCLVNNVIYPPNTTRASVYRLLYRVVIICAKTSEADYMHNGRYKIEKCENSNTTLILTLILTLSTSIGTLLLKTRINSLTHTKRIKQINSTALTTIILALNYEHIITGYQRSGRQATTRWMDSPCVQTITNTENNIIRALDGDRLPWLKANIWTTTTDLSANSKLKKMGFPHTENTTKLHYLQQTCKAYLSLSSMGIV